MTSDEKLLAMLSYEPVFATLGEVMRHKCCVENP